MFSNAIFSRNTVGNVTEFVNEVRIKRSLYSVIRYIFFLQENEDAGKRSRQWMC